MRTFTLLIMTSVTGAALCQPAHFAVNGQVETVGARAPQGTQGIVADEVFGELADGRLAIGIVEAVQDPRAVNPTMQLMVTDGEITETIAGGVIRAYPAPVGAAIAFINAERDSFLWDGADVIDLEIDRRASQFAWFPDGESLALTCFDPDWTVERQTNADSVEEFLRLNNNDIYLYRLADGELTPLVIHPEADWAPIISPDGDEMVFNSTRINSRASMFQMNLATGEITPLSIPDPSGGYEGNLPVPLVNQSVWLDDVIYYATSRPDGVHEIRSVDTDGSDQTVLGLGTHPQLIEGGTALALLSASGEIVTVDIMGGE